MQNLNPLRRCRRKLFTNPLVISTEVMSGEIMVFLIVESLLLLYTLLSYLIT